MCRSDANQQLFSMKMLWPDKQTSMFYLRLLSVVALIGPSIFYLVVGLSFFCVSFLIGTDQSANRWPPTVAIPRQSDRPSSSLIRFHLQQQQQQQDPLSRHLLGSLASFLLPVSLNLSEYIFFFESFDLKKKKNFSVTWSSENYIRWPDRPLASYLFSFERRNLVDRRHALEFIWNFFFLPLMNY